jgi:putative ABC transport system permease protein
MSDTRARRVYRLLLWAYPAAHRERWGAEMEDAFLALLRMDRKRLGPLGSVRCWAGALMDASVRGLVMRAQRTTPRRGAVGAGQAVRRRRPAGTRYGHQDEMNSRSGGEEMLETLVSDVRYTVRALARRPIFAATAVLTIAIGIGANTAVFTVVNGFLFTPLPYDDPDELVAIWAAHPGLGWSGTDVNWADAWDWRERSSTLEDLTVFNDDGFNLTGGDAPELVSAVRVTPNFFSVVGRQPVFGRDFLPEEIGDGRDRVVILTDGFWERRFARGSHVLGSTLVLDGVAVMVVGIMPPDFVFHDDRPDLFRPWGFEMASAPRDSHSANAIGRMRDGVDVDAVREDLEAIAAQLGREYEESEGWTVEVYPLHQDVVGDVASQASVVLMAAVGFILLMACVNVANLLLARGGGRSREIAVRVALGAGRGRVMRQLLTESLVLAVIGGLLGTIGAIWGYRAIVAGLPSSLPPVFRFEMDATVLGFTAAITVGAALLFGMIPALRATGDRATTLREGGRGGAGRVATRFGSALVVLQTAMAVVLLVGGGLLMKSVAGMRGQDFGFVPENVLTARIALPATQYDSREASEAYWREVTQRIQEIPGVLGVGTTQSHPLMGSNWGRTIQIAGQDLAEGQDRTVRLTLASPGLFETLRFGMVRGRTFTEADGAEAPSVAIVNEAFVERYLGPDDDALAQTITSGPEWSAPIVGVVHDVIERGVDSPPEPSLYLPIEQADVRTRSLVMRTVGDPTAVVADVQEAVWSVDADIPIYSVQTMEALVEDRVGGFAVIGTLMGTFALLSLLLGAVGIYGVTAYAAGQRRAEIGVRLAMGAERTDVVSMVVREGAWRTLLGLSIGLALAAFVGSAMSSILIGVHPRDPVTFATVVAVLATVSFLGLWLPARRAAQVDPMRVLGAE